MKGSQMEINQWKELIHCRIITIPDIPCPTRMYTARTPTDKFKQLYYKIWETMNGMLLYRTEELPRRPL